MNECIPFDGYYFNEVFSHTEFMKITGEPEQEGYDKTKILVDNLNEIPLTDTNGYVSGGIKFYEMDQLFSQLSSPSGGGIYFRKVIIPNDATVVQKPDHYLTNKIILLERMKICDMTIWNNEKTYITELKKNPTLIKYVKNISPELGLELVKKQPNIIDYIDDQTHEMCVHALTEQPHLLNKIKHPTFEMFREVIKKKAQFIYQIYKIVSEEQLIELFDLNMAIFSTMQYSMDQLPHNTNYKRYALNKNGLLLEFVNSKTQELCNIAFENTIYAFKHIPDHFKTYDMCVKVLEIDVKAFSIIPQRYLDNELCLKYLKIYPQLINKIHNPTDEMCMEVSTTMPSFLSKVKNIELLDGVDPIKIIKSNPLHIKNIVSPTYEMFLEAVKGNGNLLHLVPSQMVTDELNMAAIKQNGNAIKHVINQTKELCFESLKQDPNNLQYILIKDMEIYRFMINLNVNNIQLIQYINKQTDISNGIDDDDMLLLQLECVLKNGLTLGIIEPQNYEMCEIAINNNAKAIKFVKSHLLDIHLCELAFENDPDTFKLIKYKTLTMCKDAIDYDPFNIKHIDEGLLTEAMCLYAVNKNYKVLGLIKNQSFDLCMFAVKKYPESINHIQRLNETKLIHLWAYNYKIKDFVKDIKKRNRLHELNLENFGSK